MGTALYIALDNDDPGFETFVNGKAFNRASDDINKICASLGLPSIDGFISMSMDEVGDLLGEEFDIPEVEEDWFTPDQGIQVFESLRDHLQSNPKAVDDASAVAEDIEEYLLVLRQAKGIGAKWRLSVDI